MKNAKTVQNSLIQDEEYNSEYNSVVTQYSKVLTTAIYEPSKNYTESLYDELKTEHSLAKPKEFIHVDNDEILYYASHDDDTTIRGPSQKVPLTATIKQLEESVTLYKNSVKIEEKREASKITITCPPSKSQYSHDINYPILRD